MSRLFLKALEILKEKRKLKRISQEEAGAMIGCNQSQFGKKERGKQQFTLAEFCLLAEALDFVEEVQQLFIL